MTTTLRLLLAAAFLAVAASTASAQYIADRIPSGVRYRRNNDVHTEERPSVVFVAERQPRRLWPWFALGGAVVGAASLTVWAVRQCDMGCRDDGGLFYSYTYFPAIGAVLGAIVGGVIGGQVDRARR